MFEKGVHQPESKHPTNHPSSLFDKLFLSEGGGGGVPFICLRFIVIVSGGRIKQSDFHSVNKNKQHLCLFLCLKKSTKEKAAAEARDDDGGDDGEGEEGALACGVSEEALHCRDGAPGFHDRRLRE